MSKFYLMILLGCWAQLAQAQDLPLKGMVRDSSGRAVPGASVTVMPGGTLTHTDTLGRFGFLLPAGRYQVRATAVGFTPCLKTVRMPYTGTLGLTLVPTVNRLEEVVVSTGYQQLPRERATGSFVTVDKNLAERSVSTDVLDRLKGVVPGLSFNNVGTRISIRGQSTLFSNADPLIVVDGFPYNEPIGNLNPNDVESISVLKDAAAASIWGSKAGNGVIVITTRKGHYGQPLRTIFNASLNIGARPDLYYQPRMSAGDYIALEKQLFSEGYYNSTENADGHPPLSPVVELLIAARDGKVSAAGAAAQISALGQLDVRRDLSRYFYRPSADQQYSFGLDGGAPGQRYAYSLGYDHDLSNAADNGSSRITAGGSHTFRLAQDKLELGFSINVVETLTENNNPGNLTWNNGAKLFPYAQLASAGGQPLAVIHDYRQAFVDAAPGAGLLDWSYSPLGELRSSDNRAADHDYRLGTSAVYQLLPGLQAAFRYQYDHALQDSRQLYSAGSYTARNLVNRFTQADGDGNLTRPVPLGGILDQTNGASVSHDGRLQLDYNLSSGRSELSAITGYELQSLHVTSGSYRLYGYDEVHATALPVDAVTTFSYYDNPYSGSTIPLNQAQTDATDHYRSYYANAAYTYDRRWTLSGSARTDQSNLFGVRTNQKGVPLWSAGAAWDIGRESFYHLSWLPDLRLRATYGYNGNSNKNLSAYTTAMYFDGSQSQTALPYAQVLNPPNPELRWERIRHINFGLDFATRDQRLSGTLEYFLKSGLDLIGNTSLAPSTGVSVFTGNTADTRGHGLDFNLSYRVLRRSLSWTTAYFVSYVADRVTHYDQPSYATDYLTFGNLGMYPLAGKPLYAIYSYRWSGLDPQTGDPRGYVSGMLSKDYAALTGNTDPAGLVFNGSARPVVFGAWRNTFSYKAWSLSANISYELGYWFRRSSVYYADDHGLSQQSGDWALRWQHPGDERHTRVPSMPAVSDLARDNFYTYSSVLVEKGDNIRLQDLRLSYRMTRGSLNLEIYGYAANLGILWRANPSHLDPDNPNGYPVPRTVAGGLRLTY